MEKTAYSNLFNNIKNWPLSRKMSLAIVTLLSIVLFSVIIFQANQAEYRPLYTEISQREAASVTNWLKEQAIPYQLKNDGRSIYVPADMVYEARLDLAGAGLPKQGGVGFEIFDNQGFGVTNFTQKINYQRALQGELARTISDLEAVKSTRVHLVLPEKSLLQDQQERPKASVVLDLHDGFALDGSQIQGITHLVAGSIEGLEKNMVTVVDTSGRTLNQSSGGDSDQMMLPEKLKFKNTLEAGLEKRAQSLLDRALGPGNSVVRVTANLDFTQEAITSEEFDPDSIVPRSEKVTESKSGKKQTGGVPGVESNLKENSREESFDETTQTSEVTNYEISKTVKKIITPVGKVKNISAAVLLSEKREPAAGGGDAPPVSFSAEEIDAIKKMVSTALGIDAARGDRIEVVSMPFSQSFHDVSSPDLGPSIQDYLPYLKYLLLLIGAFFLYRLLVRPVIQTLRAESVTYNKTVQELESEYAEEVKALDPPERLRRELAENSVTPTRVIRAWLKEGKV